MVKIAYKNTVNEKHINENAFINPTYQPRENYKFYSAKEAKRLRTTPFKLTVLLPEKSLNRSAI